MKNLPKVSILIPVFNVENYINQCLQSVMRQSYQGPMECILVDDCGKDKSIEIAEALIAEYKGSIEFHILRHNHNRGLAAARNTAVYAAHGQFIMHLDSDDWLEDFAVDNLVQTQIATNADIVSGNAIAHYADKQEFLIEPEYSDKQEMIMQTIQLTLDHVIWRRLIKSSLYRENNIRAVEGVNVGEDHHTLPRLVYYADSIAKCDKIVYHYNCMNPTSYMNATGLLRRYRSDRDSINILLSFFQQENEETYVRELNKIKINFIYSRFFSVIKSGNRTVYNEMCFDWDSIDYSYKSKAGISYCSNFLLSQRCYFLNRLRVFIRVLIKKIFGLKFYRL